MAVLPLSVSYAIFAHTASGVERIYALKQRPQTKPNGVIGNRDIFREVFDVMRRASWHTFQVLTKRAERMETLGRKLDWPSNVWMGVSVETPKYLYRLDHLRRTPARVRFISFEPLLEALGEIDLDDLHWAIVGGESGPGARPIDAATRAVAPPSGMSPIRVKARTKDAESLATT